MKKLIIPIVLILLIGTAVFVYATWNQNEKTISIPIKKGWNLIPGTAWELQKSDSPMKFDDFKYSFFYDRNSREYKMTLKDGQWLYESNQEFVLSYTEEDSVYASHSSIWVYSEKEGNLIFMWGHSSFNDELFELSTYDLKQGWNFLFLIPKMAGSPISEIKGSCNVEKAYGWDYNAGQGYWNNLLDETLPSEAIGVGFVIKVSDDCILGEKSPSVPPLPE